MGFVGMSGRRAEWLRSTHEPLECVITSAGQRSKKAEEEQATITWVDEAGFSLLPMAVSTWAPYGQTPILRVKLTRDHLSAISGITLDGRLFMQVRPTASAAEAGVGALRVCSYARSKASLCSSGTAHQFTAPMRSRTRL
jgi:hypothetical protein